MQTILIFEVEPTIPMDAQLELDSNTQCNYTRFEHPTSRRLHGAYCLLGGGVVGPFNLSSLFWDVQVFFLGSLLLRKAGLRR